MRRAGGPVRDGNHSVDSVTARVLCALDTPRQGADRDSQFSQIFSFSAYLLSDFDLRRQDFRFFDFACTFFPANRSSVPAVIHITSSGNGVPCKPVLKSTGGEENHLIVVNLETLIICS